MNNLINEKNCATKKNIICLMGQTATGKTNLAIEICRRFPVEIISADSSMIYRGMDIGTAKPKLTELKIAPHHLIDILDPKEIYSAGKFYKDAALAIETIINKGKIPMFVGGTMLYFRAIQNGLSLLPEPKESIRKKLEEDANNFGTQALHERLSKIDPKRASSISPNDLQRLQRALEIYELSEKSPTTIYNENKMQPLPYSFISVTPNAPDVLLLSELITNRFDAMLEAGFLKEAEALFNRQDLSLDLPSMRAVGFKQAWQYFSGKIDFNAMRMQAIIATRQLAKKQRTWLKSWPNLITIKNIDELIKILVN